MFTPEQIIHHYQMLTPEQIINHYQMRRLEGEGGMVYQAYISDETFPDGALPGRQGERPYGSSIIYLLSGGAFSRMHRLSSDEIFHFYQGDACEMLLLAPDGTGKKVRLGPDILSGDSLQVVVPRGWWQGTRIVPGGPHTWALLGTSMSPGYSQAEYEDGDFAELVSQYPDFREDLEHLAGSAVYV